MKLIMKIAISIWKNRVSPVFDTAAHIEFIEANKNGLLKQETICVESLTIFQSIDLLKKLKVDLLICGGITQNTFENIRAKNIKIIPFICGDINKILQATISGKDIKRLFAMPGQLNKEN